ncbi:MAG: glycosyltransferase family 2 protein [Oscillospiraceae bacterium]|nr:glycosyltransferase family 2 protein [Oscillospiraceae bacterium]
MLVSIIVPCYNEQEALPLFLEEIKRVERRMQNTYSCRFELLFVNDGSSDGTLGILRDFSQRYPDIKYLSFSRNFGKEAAIYAGLQNCTGDYVSLMDADLQDPPDMLLPMYAGLQSGAYDCVAARWFDRRGEPPIRSFFACRFYGLINRISNTEIVDGARDFRMMTRQMVDAILDVNEYNRFSKGIFSWVGFRTKWLPYENVERVAGQTKWSFRKLLIYSLQGIIDFSTVPLAIASVMGGLLCSVAFVMIVSIIVKTLLFDDQVGGWLLLAGITMFMGGLQLFCIGILGQYLAKTYMETKRRPIYILAEKHLEAKGEGAS